MRKQDLWDSLYKTIETLGGLANIVQICSAFWDKYEHELEESGTLFYTWQYDIRWAATMLRKQGRMKAADRSPKGIWEIL